MNDKADAVKDETEDVDHSSDFRRDLQTLINKHGMEIGSHTPDFILADYLNDCLAAFDNAVYRRRKWYKRPAPDGE